MFTHTQGGNGEHCAPFILSALSHLGKELTASFLWVCRGSSMSDSSDDERPAREEEVT